MPFKIVYYSDLQLHDWQSRDNPNFWKLGLTCIDKVYDIADRNDADLVIFGGDLFQSKRTLRSDIASATYSTLQQKITERKKMQHWFIAGNHDWYNGECTLTAIHRERKKGNHVRVFTRPEWVPCEFGDGPSFAVIPFGHWTLDDLPNPEVEYYVALYHSPFNGARISHAIQDKHADPDCYVEIAHGAELALCGHYHDQQIIHDCIRCVGAPMYFCWSDVDATVGRGCFLISMGEKTHVDKFDFNMPRFVSTPELSTSSADFVRFLQRKKDEDTVETRVHDKVTPITSGNKSSSLKAYINAVAPDMDKMERKEVLSLGLEMFACTE